MISDRKLLVVAILIFVENVFSFNIEESRVKFVTPMSSATRMKRSSTKEISFFGEDINWEITTSNQTILEIGSPKSSRDPPNSNKTRNYKNSGDIFRCDISDIFQSFAQTCQVTTPPMKRRGDNFGLSLINSPYPEKKIAVSTSHSEKCDGENGDKVQPGVIYTKKGENWRSPKTNDVIFKPECFKIAMVDLIFVLDGSGSVREHNFELMLKWTKSVAHSLMETIGSDLRIGVIQYSSSPTVEIPLTKFETEQEFDSKVKTIKQKYGDTYTGDAMEKVGELVAEPKPIQLGDYQNIMILLTDGKSQRNYKLKREARELQKAGVKSFAVGVAGANMNELKIITNGDTSRIFSVTDFALLQNIVDELQTKITASLEGSATSGNVGRNFSFAQTGFSSAATKQVQIS